MMVIQDQILLQYFTSYLIINIQYQYLIFIDYIIQYLSL